MINPIFTSMIAVSLLVGSVAAEDVFAVTTADVVAACAADTDTCLAAVRAHLAALDAFDLAAFHARVLNLGSLPLEVLAQVV